jgi:hypothetical protein
MVKKLERSEKAWLPAFVSRVPKTRFSMFEASFAV